MNENKHTPWEYNTCEMLSEKVHRVFDSSGRLVLVCTDEINIEGYYKYIVHCVNSFEEREALLKEMAETLSRVQMLQDLWLPTKHFLPEHEGEIQALQRMSEQIKSTLEKYKSHTS